jgi:hypothetical protein
MREMTVQDMLFCCSTGVRQAAQQLRNDRDKQLLLSLDFLPMYLSPLPVSSRPYGSSVGLAKLEIGESMQFNTRKRKQGSLMSDSTRNGGQSNYSRVGMFSEISSDPIQKRISKRHKAAEQQMIIEKKFPTACESSEKKNSTLKPTNPPEKLLSNYPRNSGKSECARLESRREISTSKGSSVEDSLLESEAGVIVDDFESDSCEYVSNALDIPGSQQIVAVEERDKQLEGLLQQENSEKSLSMDSSQSFELDNLQMTQNSWDESCVLNSHHLLYSDDDSDDAAVQNKDNSKLLSDSHRLALIIEPKLLKVDVSEAQGMTERIASSLVASRERETNDCPSFPIMESLASPEICASSAAISSLSSVQDVPSSRPSKGSADSLSNHLTKDETFTAAGTSAMLSVLSETSSIETSVFNSLVSLPLETAQSSMSAENVHQAKEPVSSSINGTFDTEEGETSISQSQDSKEDVPHSVESKSCDSLVQNFSSELDGKDDCTLESHESLFIPRKRTTSTQTVLSDEESSAVAAHPDNPSKRLKKKRMILHHSSQEQKCEPIHHVILPGASEKHFNRNSHRSFQRIPPCQMFFNTVSSFFPSTCGDS